MKEFVAIAAVALLLLVARPKPAVKSPFDHRSQVAAWLAYYAVNTPKAAPRPEPKPEPTKPSAKPKVQLNTFGLPVGTPPNK